MKVLVVVPQAVGPAWEKVAALAADWESWGHQDKGAAFAASRDASLLSMDMGTGKTLTALMALGLKDERPRVVNLCNGSNAKRTKTMLDSMMTTQPTLYVVNYDSVWRGQLAKEVMKVSWDAIVLDESHRIKSPGGKASRWLATLARKHPAAKRLCLTGTPMPHSPLDLYGQFRFLDPEVFGTSFTRMRARYAITDPVFPSKVTEWRNQQELAEKLDANSFRVTAEEVLDLPAVLHETLPVQLRPKTQQVYDAFESEMVAEVADGIMTANNALTKLLRLQQVTSGYCHIDGGFEMSLISGTPEKALVLESMLEDLPATEPVVVFCRFRHDLHEVAAIARRLGRPYSEVSGERKTLEEWQAGETTIIGVQIQSGGAGIDLTRAAFCFYYSLGFSLGDYEQSLARLHRPGQERCVRYYHLVAQGTIDTGVYAALRNRRNVIEGVLDQLTPQTEGRKAS